MDPLLLMLLGVAAVAPPLWAVGTLNRLTRLHHEARNAWAQVEVHLQRRHDLVGNLAQAVRGYAGHEARTLTAVSRAGRAAMHHGVADPAELSRHEATLRAAMGPWLVQVLERYPRLGAGEHFLRLQRELVEAERVIERSRQAYNDAAMRYADLREGVPARWLGDLFRRPRRPAFFEAGPDAADPPWLGEGGATLLDEPGESHTP